MEIKITSRDLGKLARDVAFLSESAKDRMVTTVKRVTKNIERITKPITPIALEKGGNLRRNVKSEVVGLKGVIYNDVPYAIFVHEGTSKWPLSSPPKNPMTVRQFLDVGLEKSESDIDAEIDKMLVDIAGMI